MKSCIMFGFLFAILIGIGLAQNAETGDVKAFQQALEKGGFTIQEGKLHYLDFIKLYDKGVIPSAYGNNPATKYVAYFIPPSPGHKVGGKVAEIAKGLGINANLTSLSNLRPDEAIVFVGRTPPECRYFSYDYGLMDRTYGSDTRWVFTNVVDPINNLIIKTEGTPDGAPGNPYNQTTIVITTADKGIDRRIRAAAQSAGYSDNITNTQVLPSSMLNMGLENDSDTFLIAIRPSLFTKKQAGNDYINNTPATIFRLTPNKSTKLDPYSYPELMVRGTGKTEFDLMDDLEELRISILNKYNGSNATELPTSIWVPVGSDSIQRGVNADGPTNDACYLWSANQTISSPTPSFPNYSLYYDFSRNPPITLGSDTNEFMIVYGINHVATGKATYSNFAVNGADVWNGVGMVHDPELNGTAAEYLPDNPNAKYLYVYKVARNCDGNPHCYEVPYGPGAYGIRLDQPLFISWRLYMENATKIGPSYSEIVYDRAIKFDPTS
jgi:hypothetical protein